MRVFSFYTATVATIGAVANTVAEMQDPSTSGYSEAALAPIPGAVCGIAGALVPPLGAWWLYLAYQDKLIEENTHVRSNMSIYRFPTRIGWTGGWKEI